MIISLIIVALVLGIVGTEVWVAWFCLIFICIYISGYAWSWGPLGWLYPSGGATIRMPTLITIPAVELHTALALISSSCWGRD